jgi:hypothetical protein
MADGNARKFFKDRVIYAEKSMISAVIAALKIIYLTKVGPPVLGQEKGYATMADEIERWLTITPQGVAVGVLTADA